MRPLLALVLCLAAPVPSWAWGFAAHKLIADRFIALLPDELRPLFERHRAFIVERSIDPDLWRNAGFEEEPPNHFLDLDHPAFGPDPFEGLPRAYDEAVRKFGRAFVDEQGRLPWRVAEFHGHLERAFAGLARANPAPYTLDNIVYYTAILAHYVSDGHVPLHAVVNYDGQLTGQHGLHGRWESELFERSRDRLRIAPAAPVPVTDPRGFMFDVLLASNRMVADVLAADKAAVEGKSVYGDDYFAALAARALPGLEQRLNDSITAVAGVVIGAWHQAGRPPVPTELPRTPRPVRRP